MVKRSQIILKIDFNKNSRSLTLSWFVVFLFLCICIIFPLFCVLISVRPEDFYQVLNSENFKISVKNTFLECICSSTLSVLIGYIFAYAIVKGNIPFKKFFLVVPLIHLLTPPFVGGLSFILLLGRQGFITSTILGLDISLYGFWGLLIAQSLCFFPMAYLICLQSLLNVNENLEKASRSMGAGNFKIFLTVTLPLTLPGILSSFLFVGVNILSDFGNPLIIAGRFRVLSVEIYSQLTGWLNVGKSAALGIFLIIPSVILFVIQNRVLKKSMSKIMQISAFSEFRKNKNSTGRISSFFLTFFVSLITFFIILQFISVFVGTFQKLWGIDYSFTLDHFSVVKDYSKGLLNSVLFSLIASFFSIIIATFSSFIVHRTNCRIKTFIDIFSQLPSAVPGTLLGLALSISSNMLNFKVAPVLIVISMIVSFLPFSYRVVSQSFSEISKNLDLSSLSLGANQIQTLFKVLIPISKTGIFSGFVYTFIRAVGTLSSVIFLVSFNTPLTSINIVNLAEQGSWGKSCALASILTLITFLILGLNYGIIKIRKHKICLQ